MAAGWLEILHFLSQLAVFHFSTWCKLQNSHGFLGSNWWKKFKLLLKTFIVTNAAKCLKCAAQKEVISILFLRLCLFCYYQLVQVKIFPLLSWNSLIFKQSARDSLEVQSSLSPWIASQVQLALFHLLKSCSLQLPIVEIPSIDYLAWSIFF